MWQRLGDTFERVVIALGFYPAYYAGTWIAALRAEKLRGLGQSIAGIYARHAKAFTHWLVRRKRRVGVHVPPHAQCRLGLE